MGARAYATVWEPLLRGKFGDAAAEIAMPWFWARVHDRTQSLGYLRGGFQQLYDRMAEEVRGGGGETRFGASVTSVRTDNGGFIVETSEGSERFDRVISTFATRLTARLVPELPQEWRERHEWGRAYGAHCVVLALVEHTNYMPAADYGGRHLVYLGNYRPMDDPLMTARLDTVLDEFLPHLERLNPGFKRRWVTDAWAFAAPFAQPIVTVDYRDHIPPFHTPIPNLWVASMFQVYPHDRGQNYSIALADRLVETDRLLRRGEVIEPGRLDLDVRHGRTGSVDADRPDRVVDQGQPYAGHLEAAPHEYDHQNEEEQRLHRAPACAPASSIPAGLVVLDADYLAGLGTFDVVYSWGVRHHTGAMSQAIDNVLPLVAPGGLLALAIYNDQGRRSRAALAMKRRYVRAGRIGRAVELARFAIPHIIMAACLDILRRRNPLRRYRERERGMSVWHDIVDWVGGYPFEVAKPEAILDAIHPHGFDLVRMRTAGGGPATTSSPSEEGSAARVERGADRVEGSHDVEWTADKVTRFWDNSAHPNEFYFSATVAPALASWIVRMARPGRFVVDLGCGHGHLLEEMEALGYLPFGVDSSAESLRHAAERIGEDRVALGSVTRIPLDAGRAQGLLLVETIEHVLDEDLVPMMKEIRRVLGPGCPLVITTPNDEDLEVAKVTCPDCSARFHPMQHVRSWTAETVAHFLRDNGFCRVQTFETHLPPGRGLLALYRQARFRLRRSKPHLLAVARTS